MVRNTDLLNRLCLRIQFSFRITGIRISAAIRLAYLKALFAQSINALDKLPPGQSATMITASANALQLGISEKLSTCLQSTALLISAYVVAFKYNWQLTLVASSVLIFVLVVYSIIIPISLKFQRSVDHANEKAGSIASEVFGSIRMVVACGAENRVAASYSKWIDEARRRGLKLSSVLGIQFAPVFFSIYADFALVFWFGVHHIQGVSTVLM
jgi:ATP-binding cassette, subfamily B (MDR/TAP), member 1